MFRYASISSINICRFLCTNTTRNNINSKLQLMKSSSNYLLLACSSSVSNGASGCAHNMIALEVSGSVDPSVLSEADISSSYDGVRGIIETILSSEAVSSTETLVDPPTLSSYNQTNYDCMSGVRRLPHQCCFGPFHLSRVLPRSVYAQKSTGLESTQVDLAVSEVADSSSIGVKAVTETILSSKAVSSAEAETIVDPASSGVVHTLDLDEQTQFISDALTISVQKIEKVATALAKNGEPTLRSLGLADNWPPGLVQQAFEFLHCVMSLPWWYIIVGGTFVLRLFFASLQAKSLQQSAKRNNNVPHMQEMHVKLMEDDMTIFTKMNMNLYKCLWIPLCKLVLASFAMGLGEMASLPVESMKTGGVFWFKDLTLADPFCILPLTTAATLYILLKMEPAELPNSWVGQVRKYVKRATPIAVLLLTMNYPAALVCCAATWNVVALAQLILSLDVLTKYNTEESLRHNLDNLLRIMRKRSEIHCTDPWENHKIDREMALKKYNSEIYKRAGRAPIIKTYRYDPTKPSSSSATKTNHAKSTKSV